MVRSTLSAPQNGLIRAALFVLFVTTPAISQGRQDRPSPDAKSLEEQVTQKIEKSLDSVGRLGNRVLKDIQEFVTSKDPQERLPLAASLGNLPSVIYLVDKQSVPINYKDQKRGRTALAWAIASRTDPITRLAMVKYLLSKPGIDVNTRDDDGRTPLISAVAAYLAADESSWDSSDSGLVSRYMIVDHLLRHASIRVNLVDNTGNNAYVYMWTAVNPHYHQAMNEVVPLLTKHGARWPTFDAGEYVVVSETDLHEYPKETLKALDSPKFYPYEDGSEVNWTNSTLGVFVDGQQKRLLETLRALIVIIDNGIAPNEPDSPILANYKKSFRQGVALFLNRLIGGKSKVSSIYESIKRSVPPLNTFGSR